MDQPKKLCIIFPKKDNKKLTLEVEFNAPVLDLVESLEKYLSVPENDTVCLYRDEKGEASINQNKSLEEQGIEPANTLFAFVKEKSMTVKFKTIDKLQQFSIKDKMMKLKDLKDQVLTSLELRCDRQYDFIKLSDGTIFNDTQNFMNFPDGETILVKEVSLSGSA